MKKLRAVLTPMEDKAWVFAFCYHLDEHRTEEEADKLAWRDIVMEFPRLRGFGGSVQAKGKPAGDKWSVPPFRRES